MSTGFDTNLKNIHNTLFYDQSGNVALRTGFTGNIIISGNVNIPGTINVASTPNNPVHTHITEVGTSDILDVPWMPIDGNVRATQAGTWYVNVNNFPSTQTITGNVNVTSGNINATVTSGNINITSGTITSVTNTVNVNVLNSHAVTVTGGNINVAVTSMPNVEISNDTGNPIPISRNTSINSNINPIYVSNDGSTVKVGDYPEVAVSAFEEPLAVGITPVIQAESMYGLDPDMWVQTQLNGGLISLTENTTWQISSGTSAGGYARLATSRYMTYQPGQGSMFRWTAAFTTTGGTTKAALGIDNIVQNTGPIDREDGYSFGYSGQTGTDPVTGADRRKIGILHRRGGRAETRALTITTAPTGSQNVTVTLNSVSYTVPVTASTSTAYTANQIANGLKAIAAEENTWDIEGCNGVVTFTYYSPGAKNGTYSFSSSGTGTLAAGTFSQLYAGATPTDTWTYVDDWDNQDIQFDPTKLNVFGVDLRWLGAGRVRFFMEDPSTGKIVLVHTQRWTSQYTYPHINKPSLRIIYRSGTTNSAITPSQNVIVTGASVFSGIQGVINQTAASQAWFNVDSTSRAKDTVWHLMSLQNPFVRNNGVNKSSVQAQSLTVSVQCNDPSVIYVVKNAVGLSDVLVFSAIPNSTAAMFVQYSTSLLSENLNVDRVCNIQTVGINGTATFDLANYNLTLSPGETLSVFINSSSGITRTAIGMTWKVD